MNKYESDILKILHSKRYENQRILSEVSGHSLGIVNRSINSLEDQGYLTQDFCLTEKAHTAFAHNKPQRAIILAAGFGMRMVPINMETPKAFVKVNGEYLIERQIRQLYEAGITEIYVVVGFMKEKFEYLIDDFGVKLIVNPAYSSKGNLHSLKLAAKYLENAYIVPCDIWCDANPFDKQELYSWYMVSDLIDDDSEVRINRKSELVRNKTGASGNTMIGICYLNKEDGAKLRTRLLELSNQSAYNDSFWEAALYEKDRMFILGKVALTDEVVEINTYEQLRELDSDSDHLKAYPITLIAETLHVHTNAVEHITVLKKGMTNRSFLFSCQDKRYIMRIPGEGTDVLINRREEAAVYQLIQDKDICDDIKYINPENGYKITQYIEGARVCNPLDINDLHKCMARLKAFHNLKLKVEHRFDIFQRIDFYESLWQGEASAYRDYEQTKANVLSLQEYINKQAAPECLTHIDAVADNFLFAQDEAGQEKIYLIDWEYAAMQDPHVDIAMFCIYSLFDKEQVDQLIDIYFEDKCTKANRIKIYCYIAACGLLWSNWCEYKSKLGVEFGEYSLAQYRYAKEYYRYVVAGMK